MRERCTVLVIGSGGREHALAWKIAQSRNCEHVYCAPGNGGTSGSADSKISNVGIATSDFEGIRDFCKVERVDIVVVGPDNPLADGIVDFLEMHDIRTFGPRKDAARLEWSKSFAKQYLSKIRIPTARYAVCENIEEAERTVRENAWARVVKADGLALGKGVFVCDDVEQSVSAVNALFADHKKVVIEERLVGEEISLLTLCDGNTVRPMLPCRDHKRRFDEDRGPNTGGMGAFAPVEVSAKLLAAIDQRVLKPLEKALAEEKDFTYKGVLYIGLLIVQEGADLIPYVLEFNSRFGDPETQTLLPLLKSDLLHLLWSCTDGSLDKHTIEWYDKSSCCVVAATKPYPESSSKGSPITINTLPNDTVIFQAGTSLDGSQLVTNGGRILAVTAIDDYLDAARNRAYEALQGIQFPGMDYRRDIAARKTASCL